MIDIAAANTVVDLVGTVVDSVGTVVDLVGTVTVSTAVLVLHHMYLFQNYYNNSFMLYQYRQQWQN